MFASSYRKSPSREVRRSTSCFPFSAVPAEGSVVLGDEIRAVIEESARGAGTHHFVQASEGIVAVLVYPMNALAEDQLGRLRELLAGSGITFGLYVGKTPQNKADVAGERLQAGTSREAYRRANEHWKDDQQSCRWHRVGRA